MWPFQYMPSCFSPCCDIAKWYSWQTHSLFLHYDQWWKKLHQTTAVRAECACGRIAENMNPSYTTFLVAFSTISHVHVCVSPWSLLVHSCYFQRHSLVTRPFLSTTCRTYLASRQSCSSWHGMREEELCHLPPTGMALCPSSCWRTPWSWWFPRMGRGTRAAPSALPGPVRLQFGNDWAGPRKAWGSEAELGNEALLCILTVRSQQKDKQTNQPTPRLSPPGTKKGDTNGLTRFIRQRTWKKPTLDGRDNQMLRLRNCSEKQ